MHTDGDFQSTIALEIIIVCRLDSKTPPGTLGCQQQRGAAAKVTGFSHTHNLAAHSKALLQTHATPLPQKSLGHKRARGELWGVSTVTHLLAPLCKVKATHPTFQVFTAPAL